MDKGDSVLEYFFEDWEGEKILSGKDRFAGKDHFLMQAQKYTTLTRDEDYPISDNVLEREIVIKDDIWAYKHIAEMHGMDGETLSVYETHILYDFEYYTFSEREQEQINDTLKEIELRKKTDLKDMNEWNIPLHLYKEDLDAYQRAEVRRIIIKKKERGEWD